VKEKGCWKKKRKTRGASCWLGPPPFSRSANSKTRKFTKGRNRWRQKRNLEKKGSRSPLGNKNKKKREFYHSKKFFEHRHYNGVAYRPNEQKPSKRGEKTGYHLGAPYRRQIKKKKTSYQLLGVKHRLLSAHPLNTKTETIGNKKNQTGVRKSTRSLRLPEKTENKTRTVVQMKRAENLKKQVTEGSFCIKRQEKGGGFR